MSIAQIRGGFPRIFNATVDNSNGRMHRPKVQTFYMQVYTTTNPVKVFFSEVDFLAGINFITVPVASATHPWGWEGPVELEAEGRVWFLGDGGNAVVQAVFYQRRG